MLQFILTNILFLSIGTLLYLVARTLPRLTDSNGSSPDRQTIFERIVMSDIPHKIDTALNNVIGKTFRKLKIALMRFDNYLTSRLKKFNMENGNGKNGDHNEFIKELNGPIEKAVEREDNVNGKK